MENTRTSIVKLFFSPFKTMFIDSDDDYNSIPTMSDLKDEDWKLITYSVKKELLINSPNRIKEVVAGLITKALSRRRNSSFASGTSLSKNIQGSMQQGLEGVREEQNKEGEGR